MKVAIYSRVSKIDQHPELQTEELKSYVELRKDWEVFDIYEDKISGAKESRPKLDELMRDARERRFSHVVFWKVDRLGRNTYHLFQILDEWNNLGITYSISTLGIDTNTSTGKLIFGLLAQVAEFERQLIIERTRLSINSIQKKLKKDGSYKAEKSGRIITQLGRPKGSKDKKQRIRRGYFLRDYKKRRPRKPSSYYTDKIPTINN